MRRLIHLTLLCSTLSLFSGCGVGLCVGGDENGGCSIGSELTPRLLLSGLEGLAIRKNDCYPVTLSAVDAAGNPMNDISANVTIFASSGVVIYSSLQGCQTYDNTFESASFAITPTTPQIVFYFRSDVEGAISLSTSSSGHSGLSNAAQPLTVQYTAFDGAKGPSGAVNAISFDSGGRIIAGGLFSTWDDLTVGSVARLFSDGTLDTSFSAIGTGLNDQTRAVAVQPDGKVIAGGSFTSYNGTNAPFIARLNADGSLDASFTTMGLGLNGSVNALSIQTDGKVVAGGVFTSYNGSPSPYVARLNSDGSLDTGFVAAGLGLDSTVHALTVQGDGKILIAGDFTAYNGTTRPRIARLNSDGSLDAGFAPTGSGLNNSVLAISIQSDNKILVGGYLSSYNGTNQTRVARLNSDGSLDTGFAPTGSGLSSLVRAVSHQIDGKVLVGGFFTSYNGTSSPHVARLNTDGSLDSTFTPTGTGLNDWVHAISLRSDGKIVAGGFFTSYNGSPRPRLAQLQSDGSTDPDFSPGTSGLSASVYALSLQSDGKALVGGVFTSHSGTSRPFVARLQPDGSLDTSFAATGSGLNDTVNVVSPQSDGKVLVGGIFTSYNGTTRSYLARLDSDGRLDTSFSATGSGLNNVVSAISVQQDNQVLAAGSFTSYNGTSRRRIARINTNGSLDTTFVQTGSGLNDWALALVVQGDGKIVVGGNFISYNGTSRPYVARLNSNGSLDTSFAQTGTGLNSSVSALSLQSDGKILVAGSFVTYNGTWRGHVARLHSDGSLDSSFAPTGFGFDNGVNALALQHDGKVLAGGTFTNFDGASKPYLVRLASDGSLDTGFALSGIFPSNEVNALLFQSDSKFLVGGGFTAYGPNTANYIVRLTYVGTID